MGYRWRTGGEDEEPEGRRRDKLGGCFSSSSETVNGGLDSGDNSRGSEDVELMVSYEER